MLKEFSRKIPKLERVSLCWELFQELAAAEWKVMGFRDEVACLVRIIDCHRNSWLTYPFWGCCEYQSNWFKLTSEAIELGCHIVFFLEKADGSCAATEWTGSNPHFLLCSGQRNLWTYAYAHFARDVPTTSIVCNRLQPVREIDPRSPRLVGL